MRDKRTVCRSLVLEANDDGYLASVPGLQGAVAEGDTVLEVRQGIWINKEWLKTAGLSGRLHVLVQPGEIRILPGPAAVERVGTAVGWNTFRTLGDEATLGQLPDAAAEHDRYLYGKQS